MTIFRYAIFAMIVLLIGLPTKLFAQPNNISPAITDNAFPNRVHVFEDYETEIERRWWLSGKPAADDPPASLSASLPNTRYCISSETKNFDRKMEDQERLWNAVIFNPVPGPPMGSRTRLRFRYKLHGTTSLRVQIYSLSNNYHRYLLLTDLPQDQWQTATVDMTEARRPDGGGGPLAADERIDDIQFYVPHDAEVAIDDMVLYDAAAAGETREFPRRVIFTGWFDTGQQGAEWPGTFEIVGHTAPRTWDAAQSIIEPDSKQPHLRVGLRARRPLSINTRLFFRYHITGGDSLAVALHDSKSDRSWTQPLDAVAQDRWSETTLAYEVPAGSFADELRFEIPAGAVLQVDDLLLYEPQ